MVRSIPIARPIQEYAIRLTVATHPDRPETHKLTQKYVRHGCSPRGAQALVLAGKVHALLNDRLHVACEDIRAVALPALRHRILLNFEAQADAIDPDVILSDILQTLPEPGR
jgi:MoxR-like ATPase